MAYHPQTGYVYIPVTIECVELKIVRVDPRKGVLYMGGEWKVSGNWGGQLVAMDVKTGEMKWQYQTKYPMIASVLATAGDLVLTGDMEGNALAFDASNGKLLWTFNTGSAHHGSPITYAVNGKQYIAVPSGTIGDYPDSPPGMPVTSTLFVFGLFEE